MTDGAAAHFASRRRMCYNRKRKPAGAGSAARGELLKIKGSTDLNLKNENILLPAIKIIKPDRREGK
jgi:hypothetical protein